MGSLPSDLNMPILNSDHVRLAADRMLCGGGNSPEWQACQSVAKAYLNDIKAREENNQPIEIVKGPFCITTNGVSEWRVHGPGIDPNTKGWLFRCYGHALDCAQAGNLGYLHATVAKVSPKHPAVNRIATALREGCDGRECSSDDAKLLYSRYEFWKSTKPGLSFTDCKIKAFCDFIVMSLTMPENS